MRGECLRVVAAVVVALLALVEAKGKEVAKKGCNPAEATCHSTKTLMGFIALG